MSSTLVSLPKQSIVDWKKKIYENKGIVKDLTQKTLTLKKHMVIQLQKNKVNENENFNRIKQLQNNLFLQRFNKGNLQNAKNQLQKNTKALQNQNIHLKQKIYKIQVQFDQQKQNIINSFSQKIIEMHTCFNQKFEQTKTKHLQEIQQLTQEINKVQIIIRQDKIKSEQKVKQLAQDCLQIKLQKNQQQKLYESINCELKEKMQKFKKQVQNFKNEAEQSKHLLIQYQNISNKSLEEQSQLSKQINTYKSKLKLLEQENKQIKTLMKKQIDDFKFKLKQKQINLKALQPQLNNFKDKYPHLQSQIQTLKTINKQLNKQIQEIKNKIQSYEKPKTNKIRMKIIRNWFQSSSFPISEQIIFTNWIQQYVKPQTKYINEDEF